jgi:ubiquinone/menaquinone biosynthesis C-methylase UbiE
VEVTTRTRFLEDYARIRHAEGRGSDDPAYYRALPYSDLSGRNSWQWAIRARTYRHFENHVLAPFEKEARRPLDILDVGAGNGWTSHRLALRKHQVIALDIFMDEEDGLKATKHYPVKLAPVAAEFDRLPFPDSAFDVVLYNASIHYSTDYYGTLREARRCLRRDGRVVIMDSPVYKRYEHGDLMRRERHEQFERQYGFRSDALRSIDFFDEETLARVASNLGIEWQRMEPWYGWRWAWRPWRSRLQRKRPPSRFFILVGRFRQQ